ncbi:MAG: hypothetical protein C4541_02165 [Candidatus Auribacter fodinae]|jgi:hypothetical protein|uniref:O-antigen ligase-related domain-containing protein n=1 Tax=Candidatus Auribacter fodinae TaxID=2093366 RepID=A0A3A4R554_9BACT|nr:MAG: hypothetical protein C4541_02165 [Candidatus Auribacter fodinae]
MRTENNLETVCRIFIHALVAFILVFTPLSFGVVNPLPLYFTHLAVLLLTFFWILKMAISKRIKLLKPLAMFSVIAFVIYAFIATKRSDIYYYSRNEFIQVVDYALFFTVVINTFQRKKYVYSIYSIILIVAVVLASIGIIQYIKKSTNVYGVGFKSELTSTIIETDSVEDVTTSLNIIAKEKPEQYKNRAGGTFVCPNHLAGFLQLVFPIALAIVLFSRYVVGIRLLIAYCFLLLIAGWILTFSRGGWIAGTVGLLSFVFFSFLREDSRGNNAWMLPVSVMILALILVGVFVKPIQERLLTISPTGDSSAHTRIKIWADSIEMIKEKPLFGYAPGGFLWHYPRYKHDGLMRKVTYTHNDYLNALIDYGAVGFCIIISFLFCVFIKFRKIGELFDFPDNQVLLIGGLSAMVTVAVHALFDFNNHIPSNAFLMLFISGVIIVMSYSTEDSSEAFWNFRFINENKLLFYATACLLFFAVGLSFAHGSKLFLSELYSDQALVLKDNILWDSALERFDDAIALDPSNPKLYASKAEVIGAKTVFQKGDTDTKAAIGLYHKALELNPYESDYQFKLALLYRRIGENETTRDLLKKAIEQEPTNRAYKYQLRKYEKKLKK